VSYSYKFTGKERDSESGLDNFGARYYSSASGRFTVPDWAVKPTAVPYAEFGDPQSLNLYSYVRNNPIARADVDGHCDICWEIAIRVIEYVAVHTAVVGTGIDSTRKEYTQRAKGAATSAERDALKTEMRGKGPALGRALAEQYAGDPARTAARALKTEAQLAETVTKTSAGVTGTAATLGTVGKVAGGVAVGIAVYNVASAPEGQRADTAMKEGGGLGGAVAGGEMGAELLAPTGPYGAAIGGFVGAIAGGYFGKEFMEEALKSANKKDDLPNASQR